MAFEDVSVQAAIWRGRGLRWLLQAHDTPEDVSLLTAWRREAKAGSAAASADVSGGVGKKFRPGRQSVGPDGARQAPRQASPAPDAPRRAWKATPRNAWPPLWQRCLEQARPGRVVWTYEQLGWDLLGEAAGAPLPEKAGRRKFLARLLRDLAHPAGTHTFWPAALPAEGALRPAPEIFWSGVERLGARGVVALGERTASWLALPSPLPPMAQQRYRGFLVWGFQDISRLLQNQDWYASMLTYLRRVLLESVVRR